MRKTVILLIAIALMVVCLASCDWFAEEHEHTFKYVVYETGHFKQYTCGCASPDILEEHYDNGGAYCVCDACGYYMGHNGIQFYYVATEEGHCEHAVGTTCDGTCVKSPHENFDADMFCDICGYNMGAATPDANHFIRNQAGAEWLCEVSAEDIAEIKMISGGGGPLPPVSFTYISSSTDKSVIASIFEEYYWLDSKPVSEEKTQIDDGGYFIVEFILNDGTVKRLSFINGDFYSDGNGNYFELVRLPVFRDGTNFVNSCGFEIWDQYCGVYHSNGLAAALIPVSELEFVELTDDIELGGMTPSYYIEMNGEKIFFLNEYYFYIGNDRSTYYQLVGKTLDELIAEDGMFYD